MTAMIRGQSRATRRVLYIAGTIVVACSLPTDVTGSARVKSLAAVSSIHLTATVGSDVTDLPAVLALDSFQQAVSGVPIVFTPSSSPAVPLTVLTGRDGIARMPAWPVPKAAGTTFVVATGPAMKFIRFDLIAVAGPPAAMSKIAGDDQTAIEHQTVSVSPTVRVVDAFGNGAPLVAVTFTIDSGDGSLASKTTQTDYDGVASPGSWTLFSVGRHVLSATVAGLPTVTFAAAAIKSLPACGTGAELVRGVAFSSELTPQDCRDAQGRVYQMVGLPSLVGEFSISLRSSSFDARLRLVSAEGKPIAENDNERSGITNAKIRGLFTGVPMYALVGAAIADDKAVGPFTVVFDFTEETTDCYDTFTTKGVSIERTVGTDPCAATRESTDRFVIHLQAGESLTVTINDFTYSYWVADLSDSAGRSLATSTNTAAYVDTLRFTAPADGYYTLRVNCGDTNGRYRLTIR